MGNLSDIVEITPGVMVMGILLVLCALAVGVACGVLFSRWLRRRRSNDDEREADREHAARIKRRGDRVAVEVDLYLHREREGSGKEGGGENE